MAGLADPDVPAAACSERIRLEAANPPVSAWGADWYSEVVIVQVLAMRAREPGRGACRPKCRSYSACKCGGASRGGRSAVAARGDCVVAELFRRAVGERRVWDEHGYSPRANQPAACGLGERRESRLVEALVALPADEALGKRILLRLARCDVVPRSLPTMHARMSTFSAGRSGPSGWRVPTDPRPPQ